MGPVLLKLLRGAILGTHEQAKLQTRRGAAHPVEVTFSPFTAILGLFAKFAETDGPAGANTVVEVEEILIELGLVGDNRREAMELFGAAKASPLSFPEMLGLCRDFSSDNVWLRAVLISFLFRLAHADGLPSPPTTSLLRHACASFGRDYKESLGFFEEESAQKAFEKRCAGAKLNIACGVLGCGEEEPLEAIKRRYRSLAKTLHPDMAAAKGLPEVDVQSSVEKFREVQAAYEFVLLQRGPR